MRRKQETHRAHRAAAGSAAMAAALVAALTGCASSTTPSAGSSPPASNGPTPSASASASAGAAGSGAATSSPSAVLESWLTNMIAGHYRAACKEMVWVQLPPGAASPSWRPPASQSYPSSAPSAADCADVTKPIIDGHSLQSVLAKQRAILLPGSALSGKVTVHVANVNASGDSVVIDARQVTVDGQELDKIVSHAAGVDPGQFDLSFPLDRFGGSWYVGELNEQLGTTPL